MSKVEIVSNYFASLCLDGVLTRSEKSYFCQIKKNERQSSHVERTSKGTQEYLKGYHTQEFRADSEALDFPIPGRYESAWLGKGYYFWTDIEFSRYWGEDFKANATGSYDIYSADLDITNCLNATFDEETYFFFRECIEEVIESLKKMKREISLRQVHELLAQKFWKPMNISGIIFDDLPINPRDKPARKYSVIQYQEHKQIKFMYYKKRIQVVMFFPQNIHNFVLVEEDIHP